jgi:hypothetical protein
MAAAVTAKFHFMLDVEETLALSLDVPTDPTFTHTLDNEASTVSKGTLNASSTVPATKTYSDLVTLVANTATIDLTSLGGGAGSTVDFTGLKVQLVKICVPTNSSEILVQKGAANAYNILGYDNASSETVELAPGACLALYHHDQLEDVDATHKDVKFTNASGAGFFYIQLVAG